MLSTRLQISILAGSAVLWALAAEGVLRLAGVRFNAALFVPDQELGWSLRPGGAGWQVSEGRQFVVINSDGFHDRERGTRKPPGTYRIAVLGNSWTEAMQVRLDQNFCWLLERSLQSECARGARPSVEVLNFGVAGYSTAQELLQLQARIWKYDPDLILLAFYSARDVLNNVPEFNNAAMPEQSPYFRQTPDGLVLDTSFRRAVPSGRLRRLSEDIRFNLASWSRTYEAMNAVIRAAKIFAARREQAARSQTGGAADLENVIYTEPRTPELRRAWNVTEAILTEMSKEVRSHGAAFWIVTLANRAQVEFDPVRRGRMAPDVHTADLDYADRRIQALGRKLGVPVTSLAEPLRAYASSHRQHLNGFDNTAPGEGHWNTLGHQIAAETMVDAFRSLFAGELQPLGCQLRSKAELKDMTRYGN
jgi:hypothetical protein